VRQHPKKDRKFRFAVFSFFDLLYHTPIPRNHIIKKLKQHIFFIPLHPVSST
jgi:hypothetical protein